MSKSSAEARKPLSLMFVEFEIFKNTLKLVLIIGDDTVNNQVMWTMLEQHNFKSDYATSSSQAANQLIQRRLEKPSEE